MKLKLTMPHYVFATGIILLTYAFTVKTQQTHSKTINKKHMDQSITFSTYLLLDGTCKQAMEFYKSCFGGELNLTLVGESPMKGFFPEAMHKRVVNAKLVSGNVNISASDWLRPNQKPVQGNTVCLYLTGGSPGELKAIFDKLAAGGDITDPLTEQPFGMYGALNDKFGIRWMFHTDRKN